MHQELRRCLHLSCRRCPLRAVVLVNSAPQFGHEALIACPDFSRWCRSKLLNVENCRPLQPCSQQRGFGRLCTTRTWPASCCATTSLPPEAITGGIWYIMPASGPTDSEGGDRVLVVFLAFTCWNKTTENQTSRVQHTGKLWESCMKQGTPWAWNSCQDCNFKTVSGCQSIKCPW